jgi:hypothetical protein
MMFQIPKSNPESRRRMLESFKPLIALGVENGGLPAPNKDLLYASPDDLKVEVLAEDFAPLRDGAKPKRPALTRKLIAQFFGK